MLASFFLPRPMVCWDYNCTGRAKATKFHIQTDAMCSKSETSGCTVFGRHT